MQNIKHRTLGLGNSNNVVFNILRSIVNFNPSNEAILVRTKKNKLRDVPHWPSYQNITDIQLDSHIQIEKVMCFLKAKEWRPNLVVVSGEYHSLIPDVRREFPRTKVISCIIGFELEDFIFKKGTLEGQALSLAHALEGGIRSVDYTIHLSETTPSYRAFLLDIGKWHLRTKTGSDLITLRPSLVSELLLSNASAIRANLARYQNYRRIFVATRLTKETSTNSANNKGSAQLLQALVDSSRALNTNTLISVVIRDNYSMHWTKALADRTKGTKLEVEALPELSYQNYLAHLASADLAIDSFDIEGGLRPHLASSDAIAMGVPLITAKESLTKRAPILNKLSTIYSPRVQNFCQLTAEIPKTKEEYYPRMIRRQNWLYEHCRDYLEESEAEELIRISTNPEMN